MPKQKIGSVNLNRQYQAVKKEVNGAMERVLASGNLVLGENVRKFEEEFARYCGAKYAAGVASGTDALVLALKVLGVKEGDEVITAPNSAVATAMAILIAGAKPVFVDIEKDTFNINPTLVEKAITKKTKVILPVHLFGNPAKMDKILTIAKKHHLEVVEDACQAHGAKYQGKKVGTFGKLGCFSFYPTKNLSAFGDGGAIITDDKKLYQTLLALRQYGWNQERESLSFGINSRLDELQAAALRVKLRHLDEWNKKRRELTNLYRFLLVKTPLVFPQETGRHVYHLFVVRTKKRNELMKFLKEKGIGASIHYPLPIHRQRYFKSLGYKKGSCPVAEKAAEEILSLPLYPELARIEAAEVCRAIRDFFKKI